jgi:small subunit ribosomal protein S16
MDARSPRDGKVIEELGYYDPMVKETDARAVLNGSRIDYWLGVGAQPSDKVKVLIKKYGTNGTHLEQQQYALERLKIRPTAPEPTVISRPEPEPAAEAASAKAVVEAEPEPAAEAEPEPAAEAKAVPAAEQATEPAAEQATEPAAEAADEAGGDEAGGDEAGVGRPTAE